MNIHGYCTSCRRFRQVRVSGHGMARIAMRGIAEGTCSSCEEKNDSPFVIVGQRGGQLRARTLTAAISMAQRAGRGHGPADPIAIEEHSIYYPFNLVGRYDIQGRRIP